jgi:hypothetical protein
MDRQSAWLRDGRQSSHFRETFVKPRNNQLVRDGGAQETIAVEIQSTAEGRLE